MRSGPLLIYRAVQLIQIFLAHGRADGRTNEGNPRGPRGPKKQAKEVILSEYHYRMVWSDQGTPP